MNDAQHISFMQEALIEAKLAFDKGEVPIGAIIVHDGKIIARAHNHTENDQDPLSHAEILAIHKASSYLASRRLNNCTMYVTLEPCIMCAGAIVLARIPELYIACKDPKTGAVSSLYELLSDTRLNHQCSMHYGLLEEDSSILLKTFFRQLRNGDIKKTVSSRFEHE